jgi:hypothetical protein
MTEKIDSRRVLRRILVQTLAEFPAGLKIADAYDLIADRYNFPEDWHVQIPASTGHDDLKQLGITDWRSVTQEQLVQLVKTEPKWQNELRWERNTLRETGLLDTSAPRGVWKLTAQGMSQAGQAPADLTPAEKKIVQEPRRQQRRPKAESGESMRASVLAHLNTVVHSMPLDDLELLLDVARLLRRRSLAGLDDRTRTGS